MISRQAKAEIRELVSWIKARSAKGAASWVDALEKSLEQLSLSPSSNAKAAEADECEIELRQRHFKTRRGNIY